MNNAVEHDQDGRRLQEHLKKAVQAQEVPPFLEARIRNAIRSAERKPSWLLRLVPAVAALVICVAVIVAYQFGYLRFTKDSQESYIASVGNRVVGLMRVGLNDHIHCAVFRKFPKEQAKLEELTTKLGPEYKPLIPVLQKQVPNDYRLVIAHQCHYHDRPFIHLSLRKGSSLLSLVITRKDKGESFAGTQLLPALEHSGIPIYRAGVQRFEIASFESRDHLVYLVSDLNQQQNMNIMLTLAPQVQQVLSKLEG